MIKGLNDLLDPSRQSFNHANHGSDNFFQRNHLITQINGSDNQRNQQNHSNQRSKSAVQTINTPE